MANPSGMLEPKKAKFNFFKDQGVRILDGPFSEYIGTVSESDKDQKQLPCLFPFLSK